MNRWAFPPIAIEINARREFTISGAVMSEQEAAQTSTLAKNQEQGCALFTERAAVSYTDNRGAPPSGKSVIPREAPPTVLITSKSWLLGGGLPPARISDIIVCTRRMVSASELRSRR